MQRASLLASPNHLVQSQRPQDEWRPLWGAPPFLGGIGLARPGGGPLRGFCRGCRGCLRCRAVPTRRRAGLILFKK
eukprot:gene82-biopygen7552